MNTVSLSCGHRAPLTAALRASLRRSESVRCPLCGRLVVTAEYLATLEAARRMQERRETIVHGPVHGPDLPTPPDGQIVVHMERW